MPCRSMTLKEYLANYQFRWFFQTRFEHAFMIIWHAIVNLFHCLPLWIEGAKIVAHSQRLHENEFKLTKSEEDSLTNVLTLMIVSPILVVLVVPLIQFGTLFLYYNYGHPWSRIFKDFKKPDQTKCESEGENAISA